MTCPPWDPAAQPQRPDPATPDPLVPWARPDADPLADIRAWKAAAEADASHAAYGPAYAYVAPMRPRPWWQRLRDRLTRRRWLRGWVQLGAMDAEPDPGGPGTWTATGPVTQAQIRAAMQTVAEGGAPEGWTFRPLDVPHGGDWPGHG